MFKKFFKTIAEKLTPKGKKAQAPSPIAKPETPNIPKTKKIQKVHVSRKDKRENYRMKRNPTKQTFKPGNKRKPPTMMPGIDPLEKRKHPGSMTSRYAHKPWPKKVA